MFSWQTIKNLIATTEQTFQDLSEVYDQFPETRCLRRGHCCALLPEMTFVEGLSAFRSMLNLEPELQHRTFKRMVGYFISNAFEITSCPFLEGNTCLIYPERFFGCRAYGLWSLPYYKNRAAYSRQAKKGLQANWRRFGVSLPQPVIEFSQPYCPHVTPHSLDDNTLDNLSNHVAALSHRHGQWNQSFSQTYFSDISFLLAALVFGVTKATQTKFTIVRDIIATGNREPLDRILEDLPDLDILK